MILSHGPIGNLIEGHVLDCAKKPLERALRDYDSQLYVKWNPKKNKGWGLWEIRRRPEKKTAVLASQWSGTVIYNLEYKELDIINHVLDTEALNYDVLTRIKKMDTWNTKNFGAEVEYQEAKHAEKTSTKERSELIYGMKQNRKAIKDWKELILSGHNPSQIARHWK